MGKTETPSFDRTNTPDEIVDLVDEDDNIIGQISKGEVNRRPDLIHREVAVAIVDSDSRILFQQRSAKKTVNPLMWTLSAVGHIPTGMSIEEAAHMELREELGLDTGLIFVGKGKFHFPRETHFKSFYVGVYKDEDITIESEEVEQVRFLSREEMMRMQAEGAQFAESAIGISERIWAGEFDSQMSGLMYNEDGSVELD